MIAFLSFSESTPSASTWQLNYVVLAVDGSPWGVGATLTVDGVLTRLMSSRLSDADYALHGFLPGDCKGQQTWECLCLLVAIKHWQAHVLQPGVHWTIKSDNTTVLNLVSKLSTGGEGPGLIAREIALELTDMVWQPRVASHVPGIDNVARCAFHSFYQTLHTPAHYDGKDE
eukprot:2700800-Amphidinium_carterae.1